MNAQFVYKVVVEWVETASQNIRCEYDLGWYDALVAIKRSIEQRGSINLPAPAGHSNEYRIGWLDAVDEIVTTATNH
ncbi:MAG: hypothetical protein GYA36_17405 [Veillonellaceae bacterium]|nr:hypothetical protein [Veillonellaceae bacterium]